MSQYNQPPQLRAIAADQELTLRDVVNAINTSSTEVTVELQTIKQDISSLKTDMIEVKTQLGHVETQMVTKDYLDEKLHDLRGDLTVVIRKADRKVVALIDELRETKVLSEPAAKRILALEPFPQN
jgi:hypothetical protein